MTMISVSIPPNYVIFSSLRINGAPLEAEPDYEKHLSQETAKLQRLYGGGDFSSFPEFTFTGEKKLERRDVL